MSDTSRSRRLPVAAAACLLVLTSAAGAARAGIEALPALEDPTTGEEVSIEAGAPALHVVFFATWCPPCIDELEGLARLEARWEERGYRLVLVAGKTRHTADRLRSFAVERQPPGVLVFDADGRTQSLMRFDSLPTHVVLDRDGNEVVRSGALDDRVTAELEGLLGNERPGRGR